MAIVFAPPVQDDFSTIPDGTLLQNGAYGYISWGNTAKTSSKTVQTNFLSDWGVCQTQELLTDCQVGIQIAVLPATVVSGFEYIHVVARGGVGGNNGYSVRASLIAQDQTATTIRISRWTGGVETTLYTIVVGMPLNRVGCGLGIQCQGTLISAYMAPPWGGWQYVGAVDDATYASGYPGFRGGSNSTQALDNFSWSGLVDTNVGTVTSTFVGRGAMP